VPFCCSSSRFFVPKKIVGMQTAGIPSGFRGYGGAKGATPNPAVFKDQAVLFGAEALVHPPMIARNIFCTWLLFAVLLAFKSFSLNYKFPELVSYLVLLCIIPAFAMFYEAVKEYERRPDRAKWHCLEGIFCLIAVGAAVSLGESNYSQNMLPWYSIAHMTTYPSVNPARDKGAQLMDAGAVYFAQGTGLDMRRAMGFRSKELYCVAPIVIGEGKMASYDFWAIGKNCCSGVSSDFRCGAYNNPSASAGLRLVNDDERPFYKLAVQQAEAAYGVTSTHPIFFNWMVDPLAEAETFRDNGFHTFIMTLVGYLCFSVIVALSSAWFVIATDKRLGMR